MASENSNSRSSSSVDSYIGSLISLTSKSEIRYEGVLYNINTDESSIGLRNVRSFGTENRKPDGPHIPPSDKVYEYILFRGSDIKDLQVKSSPPVQPPTQPLNNDPAIIQSHYPQVSSSTCSPSAVSVPAADLNSQNAQFGLPGSNFQGVLPLYQPGTNLGPWGASPSQPTGNGSGMAMPMYWQGYYGPNGIPMHQQALLRPPLGMSMPPSMQHPLQYPNFNASLPTGASNLPGPSFPEVPPPFLPVGNNSVMSNSSLVPPATLPSSSSLLPPPMLPSSSSLLSPVTLTSTLPPATSTIASDTSLTMKPNGTPISTSATPIPSAGVPPPVITPNPELRVVVPPIDNMSNAVSGQTLPYQSTSLSTSSTVGASNSIQTRLPTPPVSLSLSSQATHKDVEVVQVSHKEPSAPVATGAQPPIWPLPVRSHQKANGAPYQNRHGYRGRERGRGYESSRTVAKFKDEFDFAAMNEKFNKEEVWGDLGKNANEEYDYQDEDDAELSKSDTKPVYNKDDFFDTISCHALDRDSNGRTKFSEQRKIDTETFGDFARYRGGCGGRYRGGGGRYGRGHGGYGRGRSMTGRAPSS